MSGDKHPVVFVGAGPGDPDLITVAGRKALEAADLVVFAGSLVSRQMLSWCRPECETVDSARLDLTAIIAHLARGWEAGRRVVRLHTGDPSLYGAIAEQIAELEARGIAWRVIPGVTAAFAAAAHLGLEYTLPELTQTLILTRAAGRTPVPRAESLAALAAHGSSLAIYLSAAQAEAVSSALQAAFGPEAPVALAYRVSWPDQRFVWTTARELPQALIDHEMTRQVLILAGPAVMARAQGEKTPGSKLYDAGFSHGFRAGKTEGD
ncbi:MAG: precorrin-4 C(11)-methyltransferase [Desulfarculus sp.]|nr:precorrin-4 C(11)-methyltransferase [Desulfarculus sp.]